MNSRMEKEGYQVLKEAGAVSAADLDRIFKESEVSNIPFSEMLVRSGLIREVELLSIYGNAFHIPVVDLKGIVPDKQIFDKVQAKFAWYYRFFPYRLEGTRITLAISRPMDVSVLDEIRVGLGMEVRTTFALDAEIGEMLKRHYGLGAETVDKILTQSSQSLAAATQSSTEVEDIEKLAETASVVQLVNQILLDGYQKKASDIHLEPYRGKVRLRYRIDGILREAPVPPEMPRFFNSILSRIKIMANLNIVEKRLPQDGKARVKTHDQTLDLRISSIPTPHGESMVVRILPSKMILWAEELGLDRKQLALFRDLMNRAYGIIFVTGPTGSGKSTTLYAGLAELNTENRKIITIEDPVEYELEGITQIQVVPEIGLSFAKGLRSVLRHDPDVMMVGEVRDLETADIAVRIALTGHLILSTLHTNDAASGVTRLLDIGVKPYLVTSSVIAFVAQRLVRVICPRCREEDPEVLPEIRQMIIRDLGLTPGDRVKVFKGRGCDECQGTGFSGRVAIYEFLEMNEGIRGLIFSKASATQIKQKAVECGMKTLRQDGWRKVLAGMTTPQEILQVTPSDEEIELVFGPEITVNAEPIEAPGVLPANEFEGDVAQKTNSAGTEESALTVETVEKKRGTFIDRRAYDRLKIKLPLIYGIVDFNQVEPQKTADMRSYQKAETDDISANGLAFVSAHQLLLGVTLDLRVEIPDGLPIIQCLSKVVRVFPAPISDVNANGSFYAIGVTFLAISSSDRLRLEKFCQEHSK